jgi:hypothetical protein
MPFSRSIQLAISRGYPKHARGCLKDLHGQVYGQLYILLPTAYNEKTFCDLFELPNLSKK